MIKIDSQRLINISDYYYQEIHSTVIDKYSRAALGNNPFTGNDLRLWFVNSTGQLDMRFLKTLLTGTIDEIIKTNIEIEYYLKTCKFLHYSSEQVDAKLTGMKKVTNRIAIRQAYVAKFSNPWLDKYTKAPGNLSFFSSNKNYNKLVREVKADMLDLNVLLAQMIDYEYISKELRHELLHRIGIEVCPYCNRQYITSYIDHSEKKSTADLDHYYPNSRFKLFSLSLHNFVPACQICNSRFKLAKGIEILDPYRDGFDRDTYFEVGLNPASNSDSLIGGNTFFNIELHQMHTGNRADQLEGNIRLFQLENVYQSHKEYVRELLYKQYVYKDAYKKDLTALFDNMQLTEQEIHLFLYGHALQDDKLGDRPLSKLAYDIITRT
ncbi:HNH endonuclease [Paenibacillus typhae]|uniref:HNH endonuclease n=1 Tax=Paenibacillus typhae TaxID=1174501 RepID=UPI001C8ED8A3|nr:hypothetical protein [Paenibacillus typhae]MBY0009642.1 hypothetical protein [Paenibacillus typhae]